LWSRKSPPDEFSTSTVVIYILDNYDSFTYNLVHSIQSKGVSVLVGLNDQVTASEIMKHHPAGLILSPGPGRPEDAGNMSKVMAELANRLPILGVCLGHQMIAVHFGGRLRQAKQIVHGKASSIRHDGKGIFSNLSSPIFAGRYHSLAVDEKRLPECLEICAQTEDGEIMGLRHRKLPIESAQFHPESILTPNGDVIIHNFIDQAARFAKRAAALNES
jgi:anthranilate synthase/aminodeoxychorismate synthase-like glutamine amidotransferase